MFILNNYRILRFLGLAALIFAFNLKNSKAADAIPGDPCSPNNSFKFSGGPETSGQLYAMTCQGGIWVRIFESDANGNFGVKQSTPKTPLDIAGEIKIGTTTGLTCDTDRKGGLRWSNAENTIEMCDGTTWKKIVASSSAGTPATPSGSNGYFVITSGKWNGNLGGISGANSKCLTDLTNNDWNGKTDAQARSLLNSSKVYAFLCSSGANQTAATNTCQNFLPSTTYYFAVSGDNTKGGASFTTDSSGLGPDNTINWFGTNYFDGDKLSWTNRGNTSNSKWGNYTAGYQDAFACVQWTYSSGYGISSRSNSTSCLRWGCSYPNQTETLCSTTLHLMCMVHP